MQERKLHTSEHYRAISDDNLDWCQTKGLGKAQFFEFVMGDIEHRTRLGGFTLAPFPGNCGIVVSTNTFLYEYERNKGFARIAHDLKQQIAKEFGYSKMVATVECTNISEICSLLHNNWKVTSTFRNNRTGHDIFTFEKVL